jgi:type II secretory pathway pseudopilin PulG
MKLGNLCGKSSAIRVAAFTLIEVLMGILVVGVTITGLYTGVYFSFGEIQLLRENERATEILTQNMEVVRLFTWDQVINLPGYIPTNFTAPFYATGNPTNSSGSGVTYAGVVSVVTPATGETYASDLRQITITLTWRSGNETRTRQMTTMVSQYGLQKYVY